MHYSIFYRSRKRRHEKTLQKLSRARAAKASKHQDRIEAGWEPEPKMVRAYRLELGVRDKLTGETVVPWTDLRSVRSAGRMLSEMIRKFQ